MGRGAQGTTKNLSSDALGDGSADALALVRGIDF
jgi:hypothetical protein